MHNDNLRPKIKAVEDSLYALLKLLATREDAIEMKQVITRPLGVLNSRFHLHTNTTRRCGCKRIDRVEVMDIRFETE